MGAEIALVGRQETPSQAAGNHKRAGIWNN
jgi:hypothetical protein